MSLLVMMQKMCNTEISFLLTLMVMTHVAQLSVSSCRRAQVARCKALG